MYRHLRTITVTIVLLALAAHQPACIAADKPLTPVVATEVNDFLVDVVGPESIAVGDMAVFDVGKSTATKFAWTIIPSSKNFVVDSSQRKAYLSGASGQYTIVLVGMDGSNLAIDTQTTSIGGPIPPGPTPPVPPGPTPPVPPGPTPPVVEGKRAILIVHESADETPAVGSLIVSLRNPPTSTYLKDKGHTLSVLDDDATDENGKPAPAVEAWRPFFKDMKLPAVFVIDPNGNKLLAKESLPADAKADDVLKIVKANGG